jgi:hypothetical protein
LLSPAMLSSREEVKTIGSDAVPTACSVPLTAKVLWPVTFTTTPGWIVSVEPPPTASRPSRMYGLPSVVQVTLPEIVVLAGMCVGPDARATGA